MNSGKRTNTPSEKLFQKILEKQTPNQETQDAQKLETIEKLTKDREDKVKENEQLRKVNQEFIEENGSV